LFGLAAIGEGAAQDCRDADFDRLGLGCIGEYQPDEEQSGAHSNDLRGAIAKNIPRRRAQSSGCSVHKSLRLLCKA
jgi:hypothetical protein